MKNKPKKKVRKLVYQEGESFNRNSPTTKQKTNNFY